MTTRDRRGAGWTGAGGDHRICIAIAALAATFLSASLVAEPPGRVVVTGGRILDVAGGRYREVGALVVEGDRVTAIEAQPPSDSGANITRIEAAGRTIVPGLVDLAVTALPSPELDVDFHYALSLAHGVTAMRVVDAVLPWSVTQRDRARSGGIVAPRLWTSGPVLGARAPTGPWAVLLETEPRRAVVGVDPATAGREASRQADARVDWVRLRADVPPDAVRAAVTALARRGVSVSAAPGATSMAQLAALGVDVIDGLAAPLRAPDGPASPGAASGGGDVHTAVDAAWRGMGASDMTALARRIAEARVCVAPMLGVASERVLAPRDADLEAELALLPERARAERRETIARSAREAGTPASGAMRAWEAQRRLVVALAAAGAPIGVSSGAGQDGWPVPGLAVHRELALLVAAGLSPAQAIRAATAGGASALGAARLLGPVRVGAAADFFVVDGDPLADIGALRRITHVVRGGEVLDPKALLAQAKRAAARVR